MMASVSVTLELLLLLVVLQLSCSAYSGNSEVDVRLLSTPHALSTSDFAAFQFEVMVNGQSSNDLHSAICKLDDELPSACNASAVYQLLPDGYHSFAVCTNGTQGVGCASHNWTVDTVPPTAYLTASTSFTRLSIVQINISFSEPCGGNGGFHCSSPQACNLLVYGDGWIMPNTLTVLEPNLKYSLSVNLSAKIRFGKVKLIMDKDFCTDSAGNMFTRTQNSSMVIHFDRRRIIADLSTHVPEKIVMIENENRSVLATNKKKNLRICLYFLEPVLNSSAEIMASLHTSNGSLAPVNFGTFGMRRFGYWVRNISDYAIISVHLDSQRVITRLGTPVVAPVKPVTFLYDSHRPDVRFRTSSKIMAGDETIQVDIDFMEPVFGFDISCINISGGKVTSFKRVSNIVYQIGVRANSPTYGGLVQISIPENITQDISGNPNSQSETLELRHYPLPPGFDALATVSTTAFAATALMTGFLTVSTASLQSAGAQASPLMNPDPANSIFRMAGHIQVYALSTWLAVDLPVEYSQFAKGLQWTLPYLRLPWEKHQTKVSSGPPMDLIQDLGAPKDLMHDVFTTIRGPRFHGVPLDSRDYSKLLDEKKTDMVEEEAYKNKERWNEFTRSMFWVGIFYGSLVLVHAILYLLIWFRKEDVKPDSDRNRGPIFLPRFEIYLLLLGLPTICKASTSLVKGLHSPDMVAGILVLAVVFSLLLALFLFLTIGILKRERIRYNEMPGQEHRWLLRVKKYVETIFGERKEGRWEPQNEEYSPHYAVLGPIFDELRGPPNPQNAQSQAAYKKLFGIFRIYQAFLEAGKKVAMGIVAGAQLKGNTPTIIVLCITAFQLLFMVITNPFIARRMQFVEIFSAFCELGTFVACVVLLVGHISDTGEKRVGIFMIALFFLPFVAQLLNEWYGLFGKARELDPDRKNFWSGLKVASVGFLLLFFPRRWIQKFVKDFDRIFPPNVGVVGKSKVKAKGEANTTSTAAGDASSVKEVISEEPKITSQQDPASASQGHVKDIEGEANTTTVSVSGDTNSVKEVIAEEPKIISHQDMH